MVLVVVERSNKKVVLLLAVRVVERETRHDDLDERKYRDQDFLELVAASEGMMKICRGLESKFGRLGTVVIVDIRAWIWK